MSRLTNPSRLLLRNSDELAVSHVLLAMPPADTGISELARVLPDSEIHVFTTLSEVNECACKVLPAAQVTYSHVQNVLASPVDAIVLYLQKSRPLIEAMLEQLCPLLGEDGCLFLVGENGSGVKPWKKRLNDYGDVDVISSACHASLIRLSPSEPMRTAKALKDMHFKVSEFGQEVDVISLPGVFSHGRLDSGTRLLLESLSQEIVRGKVLDFGCGAGVIGSWLAKRHGRCKPTLLDTDAMALESSRRTLAANQLQGQVVASHGLSEVKGKYDWIVSNPPFHEGVKTRYDVTEAFLNECRTRLCKGGQLRIVANNFLRYRPLIEEAFGHCEELARGGGFVVYGATADKAFQRVTFSTSEG